VRISFPQGICFWALGKLSAKFRNATVLEYIWRFYCALVEARVYQDIVDLFYECISEITWNDFNLTGSFFTRVKLWKDKGLLYTHNQTFIMKLMVASAWRVHFEFEASLDESYTLDMLHVILHLFQHIDSIILDVQLRVDTYDLILERLVEPSCNAKLSVNGYRSLISGLPRKWFGMVKSIDQKSGGGPLTLSLRLLKYLCAHVNETMLNKVNDFQIMYITYVTDLVSLQTNSDVTVDLLVVQSKSFDETSIADIVHELCGSCDDMQSSSLEYACRKLMSLLNYCFREDKSHAKLWEGIAKSIKVTKHPLIYLKQACNSLASAEEMALLAEECIDRHLANTRDSNSWRVIQQTLIVPELEESTFIRHCLSHCLVYTLFGHSLQRLKAARGSKEHEIMIGEQLGVWIESLKVESIKDKKEGKITLLLTEFAHLLNRELMELSMPEHHSRLRAHLPPMADALFRWSDDRSSKGIWATLGFGKQSTLSPEFILFCRSLATFITTRLLGKEAQEEKTRMIEELATFANRQEYKTKYASHINHVTNFLKDPQETLQSMPKLIKMQTQLMFADQLLFLHDE
jgi:hypothetical protein